MGNANSVVSMSPFFVCDYPTVLVECCRLNKVLPLKLAPTGFRDADNDGITQAKGVEGAS